MGYTKLEIPNDVARTSKLEGGYRNLKGPLLVSAGTLADHVIYLEKGVVACLHPTFKDRPGLKNLAFAGDLLGVEEALGAQYSSQVKKIGPLQEGTYRFEAAPLEPTSTSRVSHREFLDQYQSNPEFRDYVDQQRYLRDCQRDLADYVLQGKDLKTKTTRFLAYVLPLMANPHLSLDDMMSGASNVETVGYKIQMSAVAKLVGSARERIGDTIHNTRSLRQVMRVDAKHYLEIKDYPGLLEFHREMEESSE